MLPAGPPPMIATSYMLLFTVYDGSLAQIAFKECRRPGAAFEIFYANVCNAE